MIHNWFDVVFWTFAAITVLFIVGVWVKMAIDMIPRRPKPLPHGRATAAAGAASAAGAADSSETWGLGGTGAPSDFASTATSSDIGGGDYASADYGSSDSGGGDSGGGDFGGGGGDYGGGGSGGSWS